jgi:hypothetical protein
MKESQDLIVACLLLTIIESSRKYIENLHITALYKLTIICKLDLFLESLSIQILKAFLLRIFILFY